MPCPEQAFWGGVLKRFILPFYGSRGTWAYRLRGVLLPLFKLYTRWRYRGLARRVAAEIAEYTRSGCEVVGVMGAGDSPSCGVTHTLDLGRSLAAVASLDLDTVDPQRFNERAVQACLAEGRGLYIEALRRELTRLKLPVDFLEVTPPGVRHSGRAVVRETGS